MENSQICLKCKKKFSSKKHSRLCRTNNLIVIAPQRHSLFSCESCGKTFKHKQSLSFHMKTHGDTIDLTKPKVPVADPVFKTSKKCALCDYSNPPKGNLLHHLVTQHHISVVSEDIKFASESCFYEWKNKVEDVTHCKFVQRNSSKKYKLYETTVFYCDRSGFYIEGQMVVNEEIGPYCPASIRLEKRNDGTCEVSYLKTHVGHEGGLDQVQLTSSDGSASEILDSSLDDVIPVISSSSPVEIKSDDECDESQVDQNIGLKVEDAFIPEPNITSPSESLEDEKRMFIDRITRHVRNIQSRSKLDILGKMTDKLIEVLNENNSP